LNNILREVKKLKNILFRSPLLLSFISNVLSTFYVAEINGILSDILCDVL